MQKIPSLYLRDPNDMRVVTRQINPLCRWVRDEPRHKVRATEKHDGTCVMLDADGVWWARHQVRPGKTVPDNYVPVETDPATGKTQGWVPAAQSSYKRWLDQATERATFQAWTLGPGTYELIGPKIGANPHGLDAHMLIPHGYTELGVGPDSEPVPWEFDALQAWLHGMADGTVYFEGIVWHHEDGRMAKIKVRDFPRL